MIEVRGDGTALVITGTSQFGREEYTVEARTRAAGAMGLIADTHFASSQARVVSVDVLGPWPPNHRGAVRMCPRDVFLVLAELARKGEQESLARSRARAPARAAQEAPEAPAEAAATSDKKK